MDLELKDKTVLVTGSTRGIGKAISMVLSNEGANLAIVGRYILSPNIFDSLECTVPGKKGEIQLTDALSQLLEYQEIYAYEFEGYRYDCGTPIGLLKASLGFGLSRRETSSDVLRMLNDIQAGP